MPNISLTNPENITEISFASVSVSKLSGTIDLTRYTSMSAFDCDNNDITAISKLSSNTTLEDFRCSDNKLTGDIPNISYNTALRIFKCYNNDITGSIPDLSSNTQLTTFLCGENNLAGYDGGTVSTTLINFKAQLNNLTSSAVNSILAAFVAAGHGHSVNVLVTDTSGNPSPFSGTWTQFTTNLSKPQYKLVVSNVAIGDIFWGLRAGETTNAWNIQYYSNGVFAESFEDVATPDLVQNWTILNPAQGYVYSTTHNIVGLNITAGASNGLINLAGTGNAVPTGQGITDKATLISRGWSVQTN